MNLANRVSRAMRAKRSAWFREQIAYLPRPVRILDVGGTPEFWEEAGWAGNADVDVTVVNLVKQPTKHGNVKTVVGDALDMSGYGDKSFDLVFSNSVIEHVHTLERQAQMAREIQRVSDRYWVQTPNYWFPMEPHFHFVGWQWFPEAMRVGILRRRDCGWRRKTPAIEEARESVREVRLMTRRELARLFPGAEIRSEKLLGLNKCWIVIGGFDSRTRTSGQVRDASHASS